LGPKFGNTDATTVFEGVFAANSQANTVFAAANTAANNKYKISVDLY
jgi:hypothetical protein